MEPKRWFALGTISASFLWFFDWPCGSVAGATLTYRASARIINVLVGPVMWFIALQLAKDGLQHVRLCFTVLSPMDFLRGRVKLADMRP